MALGNNRESLLIRRINVPLFDSLGNTPNGQKFFFPEHPEIDNKTVVGIEAHIRTVVPGGFRGDFDQVQNQNNITATFAPFVYVSFFNQEKEEIFFNVPLVSLFGRLVLAPNSPKQKIKPYLGKIKTRNCYCYIPANAAILVGQDFYINFTFYLR